MRKDQPANQESFKSIFNKSKERRCRYRGSVTRRSAGKRKQISKLKRAKRKAVTVIMIELLMLFCIGMFVLLTGDNPVMSQSLTDAGADTIIVSSADSPWNLVLVNMWNPISENRKSNLRSYPTDSGLTLEEYLVSAETT